MREMKESEREIVEVLEQLANTIKVCGFPKGPFFVQSDPHEKDKEQFFIAFWKNQPPRDQMHITIGEKQK